MLSINPDTLTLPARRSLAAAQAAMSRALERLSTGKKLNRASDDPAALQTADQLAVRRVSIEEIIEQGKRGRAMLDTADGVLGVIGDMILDLKGMVVSTAGRGDKDPPELEATQREADDLIQSIDHIINTTTFNGKKLLAEGAGMVINGTYIGVGAIKTKDLGLTELAQGGRLDLLAGDHETADRVVSAAAERIAGMRAAVGAQMKYTLGNEVDALHTELENTAAAESAIRDADYAEEISGLVRAQVLQQSAISLMQPTQQQAFNALALLK